MGRMLVGHSDETDLAITMHSRGKEREREIEFTTKHNNIRPIDWANDLTM